MKPHLATRAFVAVLLTASSVLAQDRPTVFIHGLASDAGRWDETVDRLTATLAIQPYQADLNWRALYESQAHELEQKLGHSLPSSTVAVGHSNGGIVARQWSRNRDVGGLITLGSPNQGAPLADHVFDVLAYLDDILPLISNVNAAFAKVDRDAWWWAPVQWAGRFAFGVDVWNTSTRGLAALGFDSRLPVIPEMRATSAYMANLNALSNRDREAAEVASRVAIVNVARDFYTGGPFRNQFPNDYQDWHNGMLIAGLTLDGLAGLIRVLADVDDLWAFDLADKIGAAAEWFLIYEEVWCRAISDPAPIQVGRCVVNDGVVPAWSQAYDTPRLPLIVRTDGPAHSEEIDQSDAQLYQALTTIARVGPREALPTPAPQPPPSNPPSAPGVSPPSSSSPPASSSSPDPQAAPLPPPPISPPPPSGRFKVHGDTCIWDATDSGPDQCTPAPPAGRFKLDNWGTCYWEPNDYPPDQCSPPPPATGRFKSDGNGGCYWDHNDGGPDQCVP